MSRPITLRRGPSVRLKLEALEGRYVPGESLLSLLAADYVAEQLSAATADNLPPPHIFN